MVTIILLVVVFVILWKILRSYRLKTFDTVCAFTGGLGSGKSFMSVDISIKLLNRKRREVWFENLFRKKGNKLPKPMLYTSIPVRISKKEMAVVLTEKHLTLQEKLVPRSVCFIDEIGSFCSQFDYKAKNADIFDEFIRFYRHYTLNGYLVCNDQCSENIVLQVRRRLNTVYNLMGFRTWFGLFYTVKVRNISISEEIKTIEEKDTEDNMTTLIGFLPFRRRYDTHCYSQRYDYVVDGEIKKYEKMKKTDILRLPKESLPTIDSKIRQKKEDFDKNLLTR
ncbi:MAG: hypothetical protein E7637_01805 [Ruminococcaceae bacterium]|nr:hypothetical protein [Oscillospiraceae bacterium]